MANKNISDLTAASALTGTEIFELMQGGQNKKGTLNAVIQDYFDALYLPTGGTADLTSAVTIDGNDFDLIFGSPNSLDEFNVFTNNGFHVHQDDGSIHSHIEATVTGILWSSSDGVDTTSVLTEPQLFQFLTTSEIEMTYDDGSFIATLSLKNSGGNSLAQLFSSYLSSVASQDGSDFSEIQVLPTSIDLSSTDGVDASSLSLTPTGAAFDCPVGLASYTVATLPSASTAGRIIYVSDASPEPTPAFADGTDWRTFYDGSIVS